MHSFDLLRGVAVAGVVAVHCVQTFPTGAAAADQALSLGRFGVQLFYIVSAMTMCLSWQGREGEENAVSRFYARRLLRIAPMFYCVTAGYALVGLVSGDPPTIAQIQSHLTFALAFDSRSYLVPGAWTIAIEIVFYAVFPWLFPLLRRPIHALVAAIAINITWSFLVRPELPEDLWFTTFLPQAHVFLLGVFLYRAMTCQSSWKERIIWAGGMGAWLAISEIAAPPGSGPSFGAGFVSISIALVCFAWCLIGRGSRNVPFERLGRYSYSSYFSHFIVLDLLSRWLPVPHQGALPFIAAMSMTILSAYYLGAVVQRFVEAPLARFARAVTAPRIACS